jgi:outer membrane protein assembly factor BamC
VPDKADAGFFGKLFSSSKTENKPQKYRVAVVSSGNSSTVSVQQTDGSVATVADAQRITQVLVDDLK